MNSHMDAVSSREDAHGRASFEEAVLRAPEVSWDPYDVWLNRVKRPREARDSGRGPLPSTNLAA